jgi:hypothetical protein
MLAKELLTSEEVNLYNPAYTAFLLLSSLREYCEYDTRGMHCALPHIVFPMAIMPRIVSSLPGTYKTPIASWVADCGGELSDFPAMASACISIVDAGLLFLLERNVIRLSEDATYVLAEDKASKTSVLFNKSDDMNRSLQAAKFLGRWFSHSSTIETIYAQLGIRP